MIKWASSSEYVAGISIGPSQSVYAYITMRLCQVKVSDNSTLLLIIYFCVIQIVLCVLFWGTGVMNTRYFTWRTVESKRYFPICSADYVSTTCYRDSGTISMILHAHCWDSVCVDFIFRWLFYISANTMLSKLRWSHIVIVYMDLQAWEIQLSQSLQYWVRCLVQLLGS
jgi:hypothetical protein